MKKNNLYNNIVYQILYLYQQYQEPLEEKYVFEHIYNKYIEEDSPTVKKEYISKLIKKAQHELQDFAKFVS